MQLPLTRWPGASPALLALHGFTGCGEDFAPLAEAHAGAWIAPDLPGHGRAADLPAALHPILAALAPLLDEAPVLLGYSMGGRLALHLALARPPRALVLVGASPGLADDDARAARRRDDEALAARLLAEGLPAFLDAWARQPLIATQARAPSHAALLARRRAQTPEGLAASLRGLGTGALPSLWSALPGLPCPTLLVTGEEDPKFRAIATDMARALPRARLATLPGAGHCAHLEAPSAFLSALNVFLEECCNAA